MKRPQPVILGCTELSVLNEAYPMPQLPIVDSQAVLARVTLDRARDLRDRNDSDPPAAGR
ncbi:aspartate/glutamate racemase family protein [Bifidobacterium sp. W8130]|nr:aspartate/glutamate racemase family protein [Bifidobacterium asteroides]